MNKVTIGWTREDGDFETVAALNLPDDTPPDEADKIVTTIMGVLSLALCAEFELLDEQFLPDVVAKNYGRS